jgi:hypothetical protein
MRCSSQLAQRARGSSTRDRTFEARFRPMNIQPITAISSRVGTPHTPGNLARAAALIDQACCNILEAVRQRAFSTLSFESTEVDFMIET